MKYREIEEEVLHVFKLVLHRDVSAQDRRENIPEWDSLKHVQLIFGLEEHFGLMFEEDDIAKMISVSEIVAFIQTHHAA